MEETPVFNSDGRRCPAFFEKIDWAAFGLTTALSGSVYCLTLTPELDLEYSGIFATGALYPGVSEPPGHPLWAVYGWIFVKIWPCGNIAARLALASALAGALTCGLLALLVSRIGWLAVETGRGDVQLRSREVRALRLVCGAVAGLAFGLDGCVWRQAVVPETWSLAWLLFAVLICLMSRWMFAAQKRRWLYAAAMMCGLGLSESQTLVTAALALPFLIAAGDRRVGRDLLVILALLFALFFGFCHHYSGGEGTITGEMVYHSSWWRWLIGISTASGLALAIHTRGIFHEWKAAMACVILFVAGFGAVFLLAVFSLTNPPMNWGYARTVEGFFHVLDRGQFESIVLTNNLSRLAMQLGLYFECVRDNLGSIYLLAAVVPLLFMNRVRRPVRNWRAGLLIFWLIGTWLTVMGLNADRAFTAYSKPYFAASHFIIALFAGCGLMMVGVPFAKPYPSGADPGEGFRSENPEIRKLD